LTPAKVIFTCGKL